MPSPLKYAAKRLASNIAFPKHASPAPTDAPAPEPDSSRPRPKTAEGKAHSSMNALRHGLTARTVLLPGEDKDAYDAFSKEIADSLTGPLYGGLSLGSQTPLEREFAQTVADSQGRIRRIRAIEDGLFAQGRIDAEHAETTRMFYSGDTFPGEVTKPDLDPTLTAARTFRDRSKAFINLGIYEQRLYRTLKEALRQLRELQAERRALRKTEMDDAIRILKTNQMKGLPSVSAEHQFVYSIGRNRPPRPPRRREIRRTSRVQPHGIQPATPSCRKNLTSGQIRAFLLRVFALRFGHIGVATPSRSPCEVET
jgi:hypothetical protein